MSDLEARIAEVLGAHEHQHTKLDGDGEYRQSCSCGHFEIRGGSTGIPVRMSYEWIRTHQAAMLAPVIREREAEAWDAAVNEADSRWPIKSSAVFRLRHDNPYQESDDE